MRWRCTNTLFFLSDILVRASVCVCVRARAFVWETRSSMCGACRAAIMMIMLLSTPPPLSHPALVAVQQHTDPQQENTRLPPQSHNPPLPRPLPCQLVLLSRTASHSPATILGVMTGTKWQLKKERKDSQQRTFPPASCLPPSARSFPCHWLPQDSVNYRQCVNCRDCPMRRAGRDEIGGNRRAGGFFFLFLSVDKLAFLRAAAAVPVSLSSPCPSSR